MNVNRISITEAKKRLGELVKRANYGGERFVLEFRDKPQAVLMSCEELEKLSPSVDSREERRRRTMATLEKLDELRASIRARTNVKFDSVRDIREMRDERDEQLSGLS
jgi:prevent-host-death family protein